MDNNCIFYIDDFARELKQHINLSENAWRIIDEDLKNFLYSQEKPSFSGFLNRIFKNYYQVANASIHQKALDQRAYLKNLYDYDHLSLSQKKNMDTFIDKFILGFEENLLNQSKSYQNGHGEKFRINKENLDILRDSLEARYYNGCIGLYLKAIYEEYAANPLYKREQIFFEDNMRKINSAIASENKLKISLVKVNGKQKKFYVSPYCITQDKTNSFNYLVGFSEEINANGETSPKQVACFRISRIEKLDIMKSMGAHISKENATAFNKQLTERGPQYMLKDITDIKVRFSEKGLESLKYQQYMRPQSYTKIDKYKYVFHCTELHAYNYFFKFGKDVEILSPQNLREKFIKNYTAAIKVYEKDNIE